VQAALMFKQASHRSVDIVKKPALYKIPIYRTWFFFEVQNFIKLGKLQVKFYEITVQ
jgi:hypothetical protein